MTTTNIRPSTRSRRPPCPGMRSLASFTPKRRLSMDSQRSPAIPARPPHKPARAAAQGFSLNTGRAAKATAASTAPASPPQEARPCLVGREPRPELGAAREVPHSIGCDIRRPGHSEGHEDPPTPLGHGAEPDEADRGGADIENAERRITGPLGHAPRHHRRESPAHRQHSPGDEHTVPLGEEDGCQHGRADSRRHPGSGGWSRHVAPLHAEPGDSNHHHEQEGPGRLAGTHFNPDSGQGGRQENRRRRRTDAQIAPVEPPSRRQGRHRKRLLRNDGRGRGRRRWRPPGSPRHNRARERPGTPARHRPPPKGGS